MQREDDVRHKGEHPTATEVEIIGAMLLQAKHTEVHWQHQKQDKGTEQILPWGLPREQGPDSTLISEFWSPELWEHKCPLF